MLKEFKVCKVYKWDTQIYPPLDWPTFQYTWDVQTYTIPETWTYTIVAYWAQWGKWYTQEWWYWWMASWDICLQQWDVLNIYVWWQWESLEEWSCKLVCGWWNGWGKWVWVCYSWGCSYWGWGWWWSDVRYNWTTLCHRFIVAWWWAGWSYACYWSKYIWLWPETWAGWWECWCGWRPWTQTKAWTGWSFWCGANACCTNYRTSAPWWWGWWYWWWGCNYSDTPSCYCICQSWGWSAYVYTASTCQNHPNKACLWNLPLMTWASCSTASRQWNWMVGIYKVW